MRDLLLSSSGDLSISNGQLQLTPTFGQAAVQRIATRLRLFRGEWFLDTSAGTPYHQKILRAPPDMTSLSTDFRRVVQGDDYVVSVPTCVCSLVQATRALSVRIVAVVRDPATTDTASVSLNLSGGVDGGLVLDSVVVTPNGTPLP